MGAGVKIALMLAIHVSNHQRFARRLLATEWMDGSTAFLLCRARRFTNTSSRSKTRYVSSTDSTFRFANKHANNNQLTCFWRSARKFSVAQILFILNRYLPYGLSITAAQSECPSSPPPAVSPFPDTPETELIAAAPPPPQRFSWRITEK